MLSPALHLVRHLRRAGADIEVRDGNLQATAPTGVLSDTVKQELVAHKPEILVLIGGAIRLLNERGARLIVHGGRSIIAVWRDTDSRDLRDALEAVGYGEAGVEYLDDPMADIPERYRQFVPEYVKTIWARKGLLATASLRLEAAAKARWLNRIFDTYGTAPGRSRISTDTVLHGMLHNRCE